MIPNRHVWYMLPDHHVITWLVDFALVLWSHTSLLAMEVSKYSLAFVSSVSHCKSYKTVFYTIVLPSP
jgi:hypothetical protein